MIYGIGTDIVEIARIRAVLERHGDRFCNRILTTEEMQVFDQRQRSASYLASRFAAKEALAKAFGTGIGADVSFLGIQVSNDSAGRPEFHLSGQTEIFARQQGISRVFLSLSDEKHYAVAMVVVEC